MEKMKGQQMEKGSKNQKKNSRREVDTKKKNRGTVAEQIISIQRQVRVLPFLTIFNALLIIQLLQLIGYVRTSDSIKN